MIFKQLDFISPTVTFYHKGNLSHSSILSGILSLFTFILIIMIAVNFSFELFKRQNPNVSYFNSFEEDAGIIPLNSSSLFHFISLEINTKRFYDEGVDFQSFRIIGLETYYQQYLMNKNLSKFDHWLYGYCDKEKDTKNINNLINLSFFPISACIRKFFNSTEQKYYDTGDHNFRWPVIAHGTYNSDNKFYCIVIEKCAEETINLILNDNKHCRNDDEIKEIIGFNSASHFYFIDNSIDVLNYTNPISKFLYRVDNSMQSNNYLISHLNFNPTLIKTNKGFVFDNIDDKKTFSYERNDVNYNDDNNKTHGVYCLWLKNRINYYERSYKRIQDVVSDIGGIFHFLSFIAIYINRLYNNYIVLSDTEDLLSSLINIEREKQRKSIIAHSQKLKDIKEKNINNIHKSNNKIIEKERIIKDRNNKKIENKNIDKISIKSNELLMTTNKIEINKNDKKILLRKNVINKKYNFCHFFLYKITFEKKNNFFKVYQDFRIKIISEEHLIRNHLNIYILLKVNERKINSKKRHNYEIKDLLSLI